jgi:hypothetical protein
MLGGMICRGMLASIVPPSECGQKLEEITHDEKQDAHSYRVSL